MCDYHEVFNSQNTTFDCQMNTTIWGRRASLFKPYYHIEWILSWFKYQFYNKWDKISVMLLSETSNGILFLFLSDERTLEFLHYLHEFNHLINNKLKCFANHHITWILCAVFRCFVSIKSKKYNLFYRKQC